MPNTPSQEDIERTERKILDMSKLFGTLRFDESLKNEYEQNMVRTLEQAKRDGIIIDYKMQNGDADVVIERGKEQEYQDLITKCIFFTDIPSTQKIEA